VSGRATGPSSTGKPRLSGRAPRFVKKTPSDCAWRVHSTSGPQDRGERPLPRERPEGGHDHPWLAKKCPGPTRSPASRQKHFDVERSTAIVVEPLRVSGSCAKSAAGEQQNGEKEFMDNDLCVDATGDTVSEFEASPPPKAISQ